MLIGGHTPKLVILSTQVSVMSPEADVPQYLFAMNLAIDFVFWADLILQFFLGFADERSNVRVYDQKIIVRRCKMPRIGRRATNENGKTRN